MEARSVSDAGMDGPQGVEGPYGCENQAADAFVSLLVNLVRDEDVDTIIDSQKHMLTRFEKTNEMLVNCNALAMQRFEVASKDLKGHTQQLVDMKRDLDSVFRRIRFLRMKLTQQYPEAFKSTKFNVLDEDEEDEAKSTDVKAGPDEADGTLQT